MAEESLGKTSTIEEIASLCRLCVILPHAVVLSTLPFRTFQKTAVCCILDEAASQTHRRFWGLRRGRR